MPDASTATLAPGLLADLSVGVFKQLFAVLRGIDQSPAPDLATRFDGLFNELEAKAQRQGASLEHAQLAKYALVALVDERILGSTLAIKDAWLDQPLQMRYFDDFSAGEEFYNKLEKLRYSASPARFDAMEVFYLAMAQGFRGKFSDKRGMESRRVLMDSIANEINEARGVGRGGVLSPQGMPPDGFAAPVASASFLGRLPPWVTPVLVVCALLLFYLLIDLWLGALIGGLADDLKNR